uniref:AMSH-like ubiquitin thioesterase 3 n=1 Tax=Anthurium amnicola TaxID=1678845 RepID=A0A1D1YAY5_9ARAE
MAPSVRAININACAQKVEVDNRLPLRYYYRIADNLLKQATIYREEKNLIDLYIILLRFSSLMCETIPVHRDYQLLHQKEKSIFKKKLLDVMFELEALKPVVQRQVDELNREHMAELDGKILHGSISSIDWLSANKHSSTSAQAERPVMKTASQALSKYNNGKSQVIDQLHMTRQFHKFSLSLPHPKEETLSRHSILGPNGLRGQWTGPITGIRVQYPSNADLAQAETLGLQQTGDDPVLLKDGSRGNNSDMESVLTLDDGRWSLPIDPPEEDFTQLIKQPSPPPLLAHVQELPALPPSKVADPRPGPAKTLERSSSSSTYQHLHIPVDMLNCFLKLAESNTAKNLETCGVLAGSLKNSTFHVSTLIIPKQESTSDSCQTTNEEEIFDIQDKRSLFPLGWIHTHPSQTCFMSSIDLHTHYSYQIMLPEAIAIVMAPTDTSRTHGIFHLSDPGGVSVIRNCQQRGFHPHEEAPDGSPIYEHCSHVYMNLHLEFEVVDLR